MNELIQQVVSKVGISEDQAQGSVGVVVAFLKAKLPENLHGILDSALSGESVEAGGIAGMAQQALGGVFGKKD